jgi:hypothetical protein
MNSGAASHGSHTAAMPVARDDWLGVTRARTCSPVEDFGIAGADTGRRALKATPTKWPRRGSNPHGDRSPRDFKSRASASFATRPELPRSYHLRGTGVPPVSSSTRPSRLRGSGKSLLTPAAADKSSGSVRRLPQSLRWIDRAPALSIDRPGGLSLRWRLGVTPASSEEARGVSRREYAWLFAIRASSRLTPRASGGGERPARRYGVTPSRHLLSVANVLRRDMGSPKPAPPNAGWDE